MLEKKNRKSKNNNPLSHLLRASKRTYYEKSFYTMLDDEYREVIINILTGLEPKFDT
jgi:hypothetical protein